MMNELVVTDFLKQTILVPSANEQSRIGEFFKILDDLIAACERKCELLEKRKRYYLQQIFDQKLRFKGFTDQWEERKLGRYVTDTEIVKPSPSERYELWSVPSYDIQKPELLAGREILSSKQEVKIGDVLLCKINPRINRVWVVNGEDVVSGIKKVASMEWIVFRSSEENKIVPYFLQNYLAAPQFRFWLLTEVAGATGSQKRVQPSSVKNQKIKLPSLQEQILIQDFFDILNSSVQEEKSKICTLTQIKTAYLSKLFV